MKEYEIIPQVNQAQEFIEIADDFTNPLDLVREAISNSYDAKATKIWILFDVEEEYGDNTLKITLKDNGNGMDDKELKAFFDLGNSTRKNDISTIGEKGHGTKVFFKSRKIHVKTYKNHKCYYATMDEPYRRLCEKNIPKVSVQVDDELSYEKGTKIVISGYQNSNSLDKFTYHILKDYIIWFTKHGSVENQFRPIDKKVTLYLKGLDEDYPKKILQGHIFPEDSIKFDKLFDKYEVNAPNHYSKKIKKVGHLRNQPNIKYEAIFCIEGRNVKYGYNEMLRRSGYNAPDGAYKISERYGIWLCKDYIPVQRKNEWIIYKGSEYTRLHAFFNCQDLKLTANRGSVDNTPSKILKDIQYQIKEIYNDIVSGEVWEQIDWLESEAKATQTLTKERSSYEYRRKKVNRANIAKYKDITLVEPEQENGVYAIFLQLSLLEKNLFPFKIIDYDTHQGIDVIAKGDKTTPISSAKIFYVEFKRRLSISQGFNHSFANLHSIVCWDTDMKHDDVIMDLSKSERRMIIVPPENKNDYTHYYLDPTIGTIKIEVFVLKDYLREKLGIEFRPRTKVDTL